MRDLGDAAERDSILHDLDVNLVVEAAAGTGKTTSLVGRLMNLFRRGDLAGESRLAAVTFTHKAAAELRERLEKELARALADASTPEAERANLSAAAAALPECHIGTIHSFCARLLRERPVEAGLGPGFRETDDDADLEYRRAAWAEFSARMRGGEHGELSRVFGLFGLDLASLGQGFETFAKYPDIDSWPGDADCLDRVDAATFVAGVRDYHAKLGDLAGLVEGADPGNDSLIPVLQILNRRLPGLPENPDIPDAWKLCGLLRDADVKVRHWENVFGIKSARAKEIANEYADMCESVVHPFRRDCLAAAYAASLAAFHAARDIYDGMRRLDGVCNFQDLLLRTAAMLRESREVRADLAERYARLLVDEVQDTDPVQAEIMFLLADAGGERDWRRCTPRPGSLFIVGDPKQSIYRFRRADIVVYQELKRRIRETGGRVLGLTSNFRSQPAVIDWVNRTFSLAPDADLSPEAAAESGRFPLDESPYSPAYVPLAAGRDGAGEGAFSGVYALRTLRTNATMPKSVALRDEAARIAAFIRDAVDRGLPIPDRDGARPAVPADFMIVTYQKAAAARYADAVRRLGLDCRVSSGATLADSHPLALFRQYLAALAAPDDPVAAAAALRGGLWGVSDPELYRWKKAGGTFSFLAPIPDIDSPVAGALARMAEHHRLFRRCEPVLAGERVLDDLGLWALAGLGDDPATSAGIVATAVELLREERAELPTLGRYRERLEHLAENYDQDPLPALEKGAQAVRIMNLHKTKGLEAPVVFLTTTMTLRGHGPSFALRREESGASAALTVAAGEFGNMRLAQPAEWEEMAAEEGLFLEAERTRLNYVAATRAGAALVVSLHSSGNTWKSAFLPEFVEGETIVDALPEPECVAAAAGETLAGIDANLLDRLAADREAARERLAAAGYRVERAKPEAEERPGARGGAAAEGALELGQVVHSLLEAGVHGDEARRFGAQLLRDYDLPAEHLDAVLEMTAGVRASDIWRRAEAAEARFREAPFTVRPEGENVLRRGVIDLVFRESAGWVIVDYKSDRVDAGGDLAAEAERHSGQLSAYARAWERVTGGKVVEAGIYFVRANRYVPVPAAL